MQDHMEVRPWRPHGMFFISQETEHIEGRKSACALKLLGRPLFARLLFLTLEDQKRAPSLSYLYVVCDKKGSLLLAGLGKGAGLKF